MKEFDKIYLSWRKGLGTRRHIVGLLKQTSGGIFSFSYDQEAVEKAKENGFAPYTEFPDVTISYNGTVLDVFAQRLIKSERPDIQKFYDFWEIEPKYKEDKFYLLGHTQGLLPTDNFEFLADYNIVEGLHFLTELAGLSTYQLPAGTLLQGDELRFERDDKNEYDADAVTVFKGAKEIGHIKKIHCRVFRKPGAEKLKLTVKSVDKNGIIKRVFIKVSL
jgi:HIRAN domain